MGYGYGDMPDSPDIDVRMPDPHLTENVKRREDVAAAGGFEADSRYSIVT